MCVRAFVGTREKEGEGYFSLMVTALSLALSSIRARGDCVARLRERWCWTHAGQRVPRLLISSRRRSCLRTPRAAPNAELGGCPLFAEIGRHVRGNDFLLLSPRQRLLRTRALVYHSPCVCSRDCGDGQALRSVRFCLTARTGSAGRSARPTLRGNDVVCFRLAG